MSRTRWARVRLGAWTMSHHTPRRLKFSGRSPPPPSATATRASRSASVTRSAPVLARPALPRLTSRSRAARSSALAGVARTSVSIGMKGGTSMGASSSPSPARASRRARTRAMRPASLRFAPAAPERTSSPPSAARSSTSSTAREAGAPASTGAAAALRAAGSAPLSSSTASRRSSLDASTAGTASRRTPATAQEGSVLMRVSTWRRSCAARPSIREAGSASAWSAR